MSLTRDSINAIHELLDKTLLTTTDKTVIGAINEINALRGQPNGIAELDGAGLIPSAQLPSYVDDVIEVATYAALPAIGETGKIYIVVADETSNGDTSSYRWTGTMYAMVSNTLTAADIDALGINASTVNGLTVQTAVPVGALFTDTVYDDSTTTKQGNTFNGVSQLVQTDGTGKLPAIDGSQLTGLPSGGSEHYDQGTAPVSPTLGATWYVPSTSITYKYVNDGTNSVWVDISTAGVSVGTAGGGGDMLKSIYDTTNNGIVDNAELVNSLTVETAVPALAVFTDTVYTHPTTDGSLHVPATSTTNNGKVLTAGATAGAMTWETPSAGGGGGSLYTLVATIDAVDAAVVEFLDTSGTYDNYVIRLTNVTQSNLTDLNAQFYYAQWSAYMGGPFKYFTATGSNNYYQTNNYNGTNVGMLIKSVMVGTNYTVNGIFEYYRGGSTSKPFFKVDVVRESNTNVLGRTTGFMGSAQVGVGGTQGFKLYPAVGTISGKFQIYGVTK